MGKMKKLAYKAALALLTVLALSFAAFADVDNPMMGDTSGKYLGVVIAVMAVALVVIVIVVAASSKKKK